jgi:hypothetical protein
MFSDGAGRGRKGQAKRCFRLWPWRLQSHPRSEMADHSRRQATLYRAPRVFVQPRFASHAVFARIRSCLRNLFVISSLSFSFPLRKSTPRQNSPAFHEGIVRSGQEIWRRIGYRQATEFDASAAFPMAVLHLSSPNRRARNWYLDRPPLSSPRAAGLCLSRARPRRSQGGAPRGSRKRGPRQASTKAQERSVTKSSRC